MTINFPVFPTQPKFKLGDIIIHELEAEEPHEGVVLYTSFSIIIGIAYCSNQSHYVGWSYEIKTYKTISKYNNRIQAEYGVDYESSNIDEPEIISLYDEGGEFYNKQSSEIITNLIERQEDKQIEYINQMSKGKNRLFKLFEEITVRDTYYEECEEDMRS